MTQLEATGKDLIRQRVGKAALDARDSMRCSSSPGLVAGATPSDSGERSGRDISWPSVHEQTTVGVGGFCRVHQVQVRHPDFDRDTLLALKCLKTSVMEEEEEKTFVSAATDLVVDGELLSRLKHRNIIKLHGVCEGGPLKSFIETKKGYFILIDLLDDTLKNRLDKCRSQSRGGIRNFKSKFTKPTAVIDRVENIAMGVARGISHLHSHNIVLRDLKPDNIGFDRNGTVKLFDLGLARELHAIPKTEVAGTLRYLAPEVVYGGGYQKVSDVYSFGVLLWELCTLETPFHQFKTAKGFIEGVVKGNFRPSLSSINPPTLRKLIQDCWNPNPKARPSMAQVVRILRKFKSQPTARHYSAVACVGLQTPDSGTSTTPETLLQRSVSLEKSLLSQSFSGAVETQPAHVEGSLHGVSNLRGEGDEMNPRAWKNGKQPKFGVNTKTTSRREQKNPDVTAISSILIKPFKRSQGKKRVLHSRVKSL